MVELDFNAYIYFLILITSRVKSLNVFWKLLLKPRRYWVNYYNQKGNVNSNYHEANVMKLTFGTPQMSTVDF